MKRTYESRIGEININNQGDTMIIVEYINANNITIQFQDKYKCKVHSAYKNFKNGDIRNPYHPSIYRHGIIGAKYPTRINYKMTKEYRAWSGIIQRCYDEKEKSRRPTYKDVTCCKEWLLFENFYEWLHKQDNFDKWFNGDKWAIDKDILVKGNKIYSPETCCLVPINVNSLFTKSDASRNNLPIGVIKYNNKFLAQCIDHITHKTKYLGVCLTPEEAFLLYKKYKESTIKEIAQIEYFKGNITKKCFDAMINYKVEITD